MNAYFHFCCKGLKNDLLFADDREFIAGINRIAVCYLYCLELGRPVRIVAFCLLNNHFHFVLYGEEEDAVLFMEHYKLLTSQWIQIHREDSFQGKIELGHWSASSRERIRNIVVYTLRQTLEAGHSVTPQGYPWCSAALLFFNNEHRLKQARKMSELGVREKRRLFNTTKQFPDSWSVLPEGMIWPGDYTDSSMAAGLFAGVKDYMFCLNNGNVDRDVNIEMMADLPSIPDTEMKNRADSLARGLFGRKSIGSCSAEERIKVASFLRKDLHCGHKQLARIVKMEEADLRKLV